MLAILVMWNLITVVYMGDANANAIAISRGILH